MVHMGHVRGLGPQRLQLERKDTRRPTWALLAESKSGTGNRHDGGRVQVRRALHRGPRLSPCSLLPDGQAKGQAGCMPTGVHSRAAQDMLFPASFLPPRTRCKGKAVTCFSASSPTVSAKNSGQKRSIILSPQRVCSWWMRVPPSSPPSCLPPAPQPLGHTLHCRRHQRQAGEVNADVIQSQFGNLFLKYMREEEIKMLATMTSAYLKEKMLKINPVSALFPQHFFNVSVIH